MEQLSEFDLYGNPRDEIVYDPRFYDYYCSKYPDATEILCKEVFGRIVGKTEIKYWLNRKGLSRSTAAMSRRENIKKDMNLLTEAMSIGIGEKFFRRSVRMNSFKEGTRETFSFTKKNLSTVGTIAVKVGVKKAGCTDKVDPIMNEWEELLKEVCESLYSSGNEMLTPSYVINAKELFLVYSLEKPYYLEKTPNFQQTIRFIELIQERICETINANITKCYYAIPVPLNGFLPVPGSIHSTFFMDFDRRKHMFDTKLDKSVISELTTVKAYGTEENKRPSIERIYTAEDIHRCELNILADTVMDRLIPEKKGSLKEVPENKISLRPKKPLVTLQIRRIDLLNNLLKDPHFKKTNVMMEKFTFLMINFTKGIKESWKEADKAGEEYFDFYANNFAKDSQYKYLGQAKNKTPDPVKGGFKEYFFTDKHLFEFLHISQKCAEAHGYEISDTAAYDREYSRRYRQLKKKEQRDAGIESCHKKIEKKISQIAGWLKKGMSVLKIKEKLNGLSKSTFYRYLSAAKEKLAGTKQMQAA